MERFTLQHAKVLYLRFCTIYDHKFVKPYHDEDFKALWATEWASGLSGISPGVIRDALEHCKKNLAWPPSIAEFISICESLAGVPNADEALKLAVRREFTHPVVLMAYQAVGSWAMKNDSEKVLGDKFREAYQNALNRYRLEPALSQKALEDYNAKPKELPEPENDKTAKPHYSLMQRIADYRAQLAQPKIEIPHFDDRLVNKRYKTFDPVVYAKYCEYLLSVFEVDAIFLPVPYMYDRTRLISQSEALNLNDSNQGNTNTAGNDKSFKNRKYGGFGGYNE